MRGLTFTYKSLPETPADWVHFCIVQVVVVFLYLGAGGLGLEMAYLEQKAPLLWPPIGLGLAFVLLFGYRYLPAIFIGAVATDAILPAIYAGEPIKQAFLQGETLIPALGMAAVYAGGIFVAAYGLKVLMGFNNAMERMVDVLYFTITVALVSALTAALSSALIGATHLDNVWMEFTRLFGIRVLADFMGCLAVCPPLLVWFSRTKINWDNKQALEVLLWLVSLITFSWIIFFNWPPSNDLQKPLELLLFPILAWAAVRFGQRGATIGVLIVAIIASARMVEVVGPEASEYMSLPHQFLWLFVGIAALTALFLGAIVTEQRNREEQTKRNEAQLRAFLNAMPDTCFVLDKLGRIQEVFATRENYYSDRTDEIAGKPFNNLFRADEAPLIDEIWKRSLDSGDLQVVEYTQILDGQLHWFEGRAAPMYTDEHPEALVWMAYDITKRKKSEQALEQRDRLLEGTAAAKTGLLTIQNYNAAIHEAIKTAGRAANADVVMVFALKQDDTQSANVLSLRYEWAKEGMVQRIDDPLLKNIPLQREMPEWYEKLARNEPLHGLVTDLPAKARGSLQSYGHRSMLAVPIMRDNAFWGVMAFGDCTRERVWDRSEIAILSSIAASVGGALQRKHIEGELKQAKTDADRANTAKGEFLAMMSHEIRTPMNAILGYADLLDRMDIKEDQREYLGIINRSGKALLELINNILDYSKIESRAIELENVPFQLENVVLESLDLVMVKAREKAIKLAYDIKECGEGEFVGDPIRLRQILLNLVNNAVKFTAEGEVRVNISCAPDSDGYFRVSFSVRDSGIGIPREKLTNLFKPFSQVDSSTTRQFGGTGLGLVICKRLVERMGGEIWVESDPGRGSVFNFNIRLKKADHKDLPASKQGRNLPADEAMAQRFPLRILLAEDVPVNRKLVIEMLRQLGYKADVAEDGEQAAQMIAQAPYDIILLDIQMPKLDGLELTRRLRRGEYGQKLSALYIVAVTAYALQEDRERSLDAGVNDFLPKPILFSQLREILVNAHESLHLRA